MVRPGAAAAVQHASIHPGGWRNFLDYANGTLGDWGVHWLDQVLWWTDETVPEARLLHRRPADRGAPVLNDQEQTTDAPDHQVAVYEFESFTCVWEHRQFAGNEAEKHKIGRYFYGTKGTFHMGWRDGWTFYPANARSKPVHEDPQLQEPDGHNIKLLWADFLKAIDGAAPGRGRHRAGPPLVGAAAAGHDLAQGRAEYPVGRDGEQVIDDPEANASCCARPGPGTVGVPDLPGRSRPPCLELPPPP